MSSTAYLLFENPFFFGLIVGAFLSVLLMIIELICFGLKAKGEDAEEEERWRGECWECNHVWWFESSDDDVKEDVEHAACPKCFSPEVGFALLGEEDFTWHVGIMLEEDRENHRVGFSFGLGTDPEVILLSPRYARRIAKALNLAADDVEELDGN